MQVRHSAAHSQGHLRELSHSVHTACSFSMFPQILPGDEALSNNCDRTS